MKITRIEAWLVEMPLAEPYSIAYDTIETAPNAFVRIVTDTQIVGHGCAAPDELVTGETAQSVVDRMGEVVEPALAGGDPLQSALLLERIGPTLAAAPATLAAVDAALFDILGKRCGLPTWKLLGAYRTSIATSATVGVLPERETVDRARELVGRGFRAVKIKGGCDVELDVARVLKVREAVGDRVALRFDANQGYSVDDTLRFAAGVEPARLEFLEQPTPKEQPDLLGRATRGTPLPIMADESLIGLADAFRIASGGLADLFNIKLVEAGGIAQGLRMAAVAQASGMKAMVGCMDESALAISAGLHLALACPAIEYADLDGHLGLEGDPAAGCVHLRDGLLYPSDKPGLGFDPA